MSQLHYNMKSRHYAHLTESERGQIQAMLKLKIKPRMIAEELCRDLSTIYREIRRHSVDQLDYQLRTYKVYYADTAQILYKKARENCDFPYKLAFMPELITTHEGSSKKVFRCHIPLHYFVNVKQDLFSGFILI